MTVTIEQQIACARRELAMRRNVYPKWVASGRMKQDAADHEILAMGAVVGSLMHLQLQQQGTTTMTGEKANDASPELIVRELTFGEKAVGLSFNPSDNPDVDACKRMFAAVIDQMHILRTNTADGEVKRMASHAITQAQDAQMWAVKSLTWK